MCHLRAYLRPKEEQIRKMTAKLRDLEQEKRESFFRPLSLTGDNEYQESDTSSMMEDIVEDMEDEEASDTYELGYDISLPELETSAERTTTYEARG